MQEQQNKALVELWFKLFCAGDFEAAFELLAEDAVWYVPSSLARSDHYTRDQVKAVGQKVAEASVDGKFPIIPSSIIAEGDKVAVQAESKVPLKNGNCYKQHYHFLFVVQDGRIVEGSEYLDTLHVSEALAGVLV